MKKYIIQAPSKEFLSEFTKITYPKTPTLKPPILHDHECDALYFDMRDYFGWPGLLASLRKRGGE